MWVCKNIGILNIQNDKCAQIVTAKSKQNTWKCLFLWNFETILWKHPQDFCSNSSDTLIACTVWVQRTLCIQQYKSFLAMTIHAKLAFMRSKILHSSNFSEIKRYSQKDRLKSNAKYTAFGIVDRGSFFKLSLDNSYEMKRLSTLSRFMIQGTSPVKSKKLRTYLRLPEISTFL